MTTPEIQSILETRETRTDIDITIDTLLACRAEIEKLAKEQMRQIDAAIELLDIYMPPIEDVKPEVHIPPPPVKSSISPKASVTATLPKQTVEVKKNDASDVVPSSIQINSQDQTASSV